MTTSAKPDMCGCGHTRIDHTFADLGECFSCPNGTCLGPYLEQLTWTEAHARQEIRRLRADADESEQVRSKMADLLSRTAVALNGPEPELTKPPTLREKVSATLTLSCRICDDGTCYHCERDADVVLAVIADELEKRPLRENVDHMNMRGRWQRDADVAWLRGES